MWHHEFEELVRVHRLNPMGSYYPGTITVAYNKFQIPSGF